MTPHTFGKYIVTRSLGRGGMAAVYQAHDPVLERQVAIKVILPHLAVDEAFVARFRREAKLIATLRHPHIVQIFDFDVLNDQPFMVMEYLAGATLKARLAALRTRGERMPLNDCVHLLAALAGALDYAHAKGAIHRDIKPANILFTDQNELVLTDFGIAKLLDQTVQHSMTGGIVGTPAYMSPEQAAGTAVDARSDLYALGVVAYELATGRMPFQGDSPTAVLMQHLLEAPPAPRTFNPNLPIAVEGVILQALSKEPAARFASAGAFVQALRATLHGKGVVYASPEDVTVVGQRPSVSLPATQPPPAQPQQRPSSQSTREQALGPATTDPVFVAREQELAQLQSFLARALAGQGQLCFVTGEAGAGKTALITEFTQQVQRAHVELVIAAANCNMQSGVGDPYLPFRELLTRLVGPAETRLTEAATGQEKNSELAGVDSLLGQALVEHGADLIDSFVPSAALLAQLENQPETHRQWLEQLAMLVQRKAQAAGQESGVEQRHILEQYTNVLIALAAQQPLLLIIDDLQWIDNASIDLLFHLSRRMGESRMLLVGTYRPAEVALGRSGAAHPLAKVLAELKRYFGAIEVPLHEEDEAARRRFVDALLDREPNRLRADFRQALFHHTGGHALFTVELLRNLRERGDLTQDETATWVAAPTLNWGLLPPRVEGVIEERIGRLAEELREALTIASIEGEAFTAEVVARVQDVDARGLVRQLSRELAQQHRLVGAIGQERVGQQRLSLFRFQHNLFQKYLYNNLNPIDRAYFHEDVGTVLEELYGDNADAIAVQLAWHFTEADLPEKARPYLALAGEQARRRYANAEALSYLNRALDLTPDADHVARYTLLLARQKVYAILGDREAQRQDLAQLETLAQRLEDRQWQVEVLLCQSLYAEQIDEYQNSMAYAQTAIDLAATIPDAVQEAHGYLYWGRALIRLGEYEESKPKLARALELATAQQLPQIQAHSLRALGVIAYLVGDYGDAETTYAQALPLYREIGDRAGEGLLLTNLGLTLRQQRKYADARHYFDHAYQLYAEIGDRDGAANTLVNLGLLTGDQGDQAASRAYYAQALAIAQQIGARSTEGWALMGLGDIDENQSIFDAAATYYEQAFQLFHAIGNRRDAYLARKEVANLAFRQGNYALARTLYEEALLFFREIGERQSESSTLERLGLLYYQTNHAEVAHAHNQAALAIAQEIGDRWIESEALTGVGHALAALEKAEAATDYYQQAIVCCHELGRPDLALRAVAGLARIALGRRDLAQAQGYAEDLIHQFTDERFSTQHMAEEYLTCYRVLHATQDPRVTGILSTVYHQLQATAAQISDEALRRSYLENVSAHRTIVNEWQALQRLNADELAAEATVVE